ncbi:hypothetical protein B0J18DRAFT_174643 [Chaetomium sp. MPI-SDFR-AT-0129]|nr:hypothetical protein B0J18DRAFT_174643 [Chaetomium sp. MPI-SDFR-AT-0129]
MYSVLALSWQASVRLQITPVLSPLRPFAGGFVSTGPIVRFLPGHGVGGLPGHGQPARVWTGEESEAARRLPVLGSKGCENPTS